MPPVYAKTTRQQNIINTGIEKLRKAQKITLDSSSDHAQLLKQFEAVNYGLEAADYYSASSRTRPPLQGDSQPYPTSYRGNGVESVIVIDEALVNDVKSAINGLTPFFKSDMSRLPKMNYRAVLSGFLNMTTPVRPVHDRSNTKHRFLLRLE